MAPSARFCDMDGWRLDWQSAHFMQYSHMIYSTSTYWQVCRVTRRCHAFGVAIRTTQRCLGHYRRLWTRQGWIWCRVHQQGKKSDHFFFGGRHSSRKKKIEQKYIEHFFLYFWGLQVFSGAISHSIYGIYPYIYHTNQPLMYGYGLVSGRGPPYKSLLLLTCFRHPAFNQGLPNNKAVDGWIRAARNAENSPKHVTNTTIKADQALWNHFWIQPQTKWIDLVGDGWFFGWGWLTFFIGLFWIFCRRLKLWSITNFTLIYPSIIWFHFVQPS